MLHSNLLGQHWNSGHLGKGDLIVKCEEGMKSGQQLLFRLAVLKVKLQHSLMLPNISIGVKQNFANIFRFREGLFHK